MKITKKSVKVDLKSKLFLKIQKNRKQKNPHEIVRVSF